MEMRDAKREVNVADYYKRLEIAENEEMTRQADHSLLEKKKVKTEEPSMYRVILLNDDFTPMDFVIMVLQKYFHKNFEEASEIMMQTHTAGQGICGAFTREVAETKMMQVVDSARENGHPLKCIINKE